MPKIVDHAMRRRAVAEIAAKLIARNGLEGTKVRDIARLAQCSTSIVSHYFRDKHDLLLSAYRLRMERTVTGVQQTMEQGGDLGECLTTVLPLDDERMDSWRIWLAFWGLASSDPEFLLEQRRRSREAVALFHHALVTLHPIPDSDASLLIAQSLLSSASGIATQAIYDPEHWPPARQTAILSLLIESLVPQTRAAKGRPSE